MKIKYISLDEFENLELEGLDTPEMSYNCPQCGDYLEEKWGAVFCPECGFEVE